MNEMSDKKQEQLLRENSLTFFGVMVASISHELNNVLSIVDQNAGLLEDYISVANSGNEIPYEHITRITTTIQQQTRRGLGIIRHLNKFAHSADTPVTTFDVNETMANFCTIFTRLTELKKVQLEFVPAAIQRTLTNSPFLLQQCLFRLVSRILKKSSKDDYINVALKTEDSNIAIVVESSVTNIQPETSEQELDNLLLQQLEATVTYTQKPNGTIATLVLPEKIRTT